MSEAKHTDTTANPAPLGLLGFGMTTVLLNLHNAGFFPLDAMILSMGLFYGGMAQVIAGMQEWKKGNTFGATAFTSYGFFWISLVAMILLPKGSLGIVAPGKDLAMPAYFIVWGIFSFAMFIGTLRHALASQVIFGSLTLLFALLAIADATGNEQITIIAGWEGLFCGASAIYAAIAQVLNETYGKVVLPLESAKKKK